MTLEKPASVRKVTNWLRLNIFIPSMTESHLLSRGFSPSTSLTIRKMPPGRKMRYTSRKLSVGPGQQYTVSKADVYKRQVDRLCSMAEVAGGRIPTMPRPMRAPLKPMTKR